jgi:hypothetical protein
MHASVMAVLHIHKLAWNSDSDKIQAYKSPDNRYLESPLRYEDRDFSSHVCHRFSLMKQEHSSTEG